MDMQCSVQLGADVCRSARVWKVDGCHRNGQHAYGPDYRAGALQRLVRVSLHLCAKPSK